MRFYTSIPRIKAKGEKKKKKTRVARSSYVGGGGDYVTVRKDRVKKIKIKERDVNVNEGGRERECVGGA